MKGTSFIWLDKLLHTSEENVKIQRFRMLVDHLIFLEDEVCCEEYIGNLSEDDRIILIADGQFVERGLPIIHQLQQICTIYIHYSNQDKREQWMRQYNKIKGVFTELDTLIETILFDGNKQNHFIDRSISFNFFHSNNTNDGHSANELNGEFIHWQLLLDCLIRLKRNASTDEKDEFISFCTEHYKTDQITVKNLTDLLEDYSNDKALECYTSNKGLYRVLNKALRDKEIDSLYYLRFFLRDMEEELKASPRASSVRVYRGQTMLRKEIDKLRDSAGTFISLNTFLSTSHKLEVARCFCPEQSTPDNIAVMFHIEADGALDHTRPFADITGRSLCQSEEEVLFMVGSIFRLDDVRFDEKEKIWNVYLRLSSHDDEQLESLMEYMMAEYESEECNLFSLGNILRGMDKLSDASKYYYRFLHEATDDHHDISGCYHSLGSIADEKGDYEQSLMYFEKSLEIEKRSLSDTSHSNIALSYNSIAVVYNKQGDYENALDFFNRALMIFNHVHGEDCLEVGGCYYNIGGVYQTKKNYGEAHEYYQKALAIRQKHLPENHLDIGESQCSIANIHLLLDELDLALERYDYALKIYKKSCSDQHLDVAIVFENMGLVYEQKGNWQQSLTYFQKAKSVYTNLALEEHPTMKKVESSVSRILSKLNV